MQAHAEVAFPVTVEVIESNPAGLAVGGFPQPIPRVARVHWRPTTGRGHDHPMVMSEFEQSAAQRVPPHSLEAEESLLGAMLLSRDAIADAVENTETAHFYRPANAHVFDAISGLYASGDPVDAVTVSAELERMGVLEMVGGLDGLISLQVNTPATGSAGKYAQIVAERFTLRRLIETANEIADIGYSRPDDVTRAVDEAENKMFQVRRARRRHDGQDPRSARRNARPTRKLYEAGEGITAHRPAIDLDELLSGLQPSALIIVGRPAMGKTAFALNVAAHAAVRAKPTLIFSLEMGHLELTQRMLCSEANVDAKNMRDGKLNDDDWNRISNGIGRLADAPM